MDISQESKDRVLDAINTLVSEGFDEPTNKQILDKMGKGSYSHVSPVASEWRKQRKEKLKTAMALPDDLKSLLSRAGSEIWTKAQTIAEKKYEQLKAEHENNTEEAHAEKDDALSEIVRLESIVEEKEARINGLVSENETVYLDLKKAKQSLTDKEKEISDIKSEREDDKLELMRKTTELDHVKQQLEQAKNDYDALQKELIALAKGNST